MNWVVEGVGLLDNFYFEGSECRAFFINFASGLSSPQQLLDKVGCYMKRGTA